MTQTLTTTLIDSIVEKNERILENHSANTISFTTEEKAFIQEKYTACLQEVNRRKVGQFEQAVPFRTLIWKTKFDAVFHELTTKFDFEADSYEANKKRYQEVLKTPEYDLALGLTVDEDGDVSGVPFDSMYQTSLLFLSFADWANAKVDPQSLATCGAAFFVAAAINEMGWMDAAEELDCSLEDIKEEALALLNKKEDETDEPKGMALSTLFKKEENGSHESIQTLFTQVTYEDVKEAFEEALEYLEHPLQHKQWETYFRHAYHTIKYHSSTQDSPTEPIYFAYEYDFLTHYKNKDEKKIKCVILGDMVLDYLQSPTQTRHGLFELEANVKVAYALLAYIGDRYTTNPLRFKEEEEYAQIEREVQHNEQRRSVLFTQFMKGQLDIATLSEDDFEQLYFCLHTIQDEYI